MTTIAKHRILREILRNYVSLKSENVEEWQLEVCVMGGCINSTNGLVRKGHDGPCQFMSMNLLDLDKCLKGLSPRKKEAVFYNVILDWKQKDVAVQMGITTVSVGQYVEQAMIQVAKDIWPEEALVDV